MTTLLVSFVAGTSQAFGQHEYPANHEAPLAFNEVNEQLHRYYGQAKNEIRQKLGPVIICAGDSVTLLKGKERKTVQVIKPEYTGLKEVAHITLGTFVLLVNHTDEDLSAEKIKQLQNYESGIEKAAAELKTHEGLEADDNFARQRELIDSTLAFLNKVIADKRVTHEQLRAFARSSALDDMENAYFAAGSQITAMDNAIVQWRKDMTDDEWKNLHVVILTHHMPRERLLSFQYFEKLLNTSKEGEQIIVTEASLNEEEAIDLLLTHLIDGKIATEFFDDPWRMHRDLLSDAAEKWLSTHKILAGEDPHAVVK